MEASKMKNMVVLKNLPSNLVEEAIVILKPNKKVKKLQKIDKNSHTKQTMPVKTEKDYILKEAEMLLSNYISKLENKNKEKKYIALGNNKKYRRLKRYAFLSTFIIILQAMLIIIK